MSRRSGDHYAGRVQAFDAKPDNCYEIPKNHRFRAYCEGCRTYVPVKNKSTINKGWHCPQCRRQAQVAATG